MHLSPILQRVAAVGFVLASALAASQARATPIYYLDTGQSNANTQLDATHTTTWAFTATSNFEFGGGNFTMKTNGGSAPVTLSVYQGTSSAGTLLEAVSVQPGSFSSKYTSTAFNLQTVLDLVAGDTYFISLTTTTGTTGNNQYFIKGTDSSSIDDAHGNALAGQSLTISAVPEPATLALMSMGVAGLTLGRRRKAAKAQAG